MAADARFGAPGHFDAATSLPRLWGPRSWQALCSGRDLQEQWSDRDCSLALAGPGDCAGVACTPAQATGDCGPRRRGAGGPATSGCRLRLASGPTESGLQLRPFTSRGAPQGGSCGLQPAAKRCRIAYNFCWSGASGRAARWQPAHANGSSCRPAVFERVHLTSGFPTDRVCDALALPTQLAWSCPTAGSIVSSWARHYLRSAGHPRGDRAGLGARTALGRLRAAKPACVPLEQVPEAWTRPTTTSFGRSWTSWSPQTCCAVGERFPACAFVGQCRLVPRVCFMRAGSVGKTALSPPVLTPQGCFEARVRVSERPRPVASPLCGQGTPCRRHMRGGRARRRASPAAGLAAHSASLALAAGA